MNGISVDRICRSIDNVAKSILSNQKVAEMQYQIDEDFRFKQYLVQMLNGESPTTIGFEDSMSKMVIDLLEKRLMQP